MGWRGVLLGVEGCVCCLVVVLWGYGKMVDEIELWYGS